MNKPIDKENIAGHVADMQSGNEEEVHLEVPSSEVKLPKIISFSTLAKCGEEVWIENEGALYRLRRTKQGKLILTK